MIAHMKSAQPTDRHGQPLPAGAVPDVDEPDITDWRSFADRPSFEFTELLFEKMRTSVGDIKHLLRILQAKNNLGAGDDAIFGSVEEMYEAIDALDVEAAGWKTFRVRYVYLHHSLSIHILSGLVRWIGPLAPNSPSWKREPHIVHTHDTLALLKSMISNWEFDGE